MTSETKRFIEISDIVGIRLACKACGSALLLDMGHQGGAVENLLGATNKILMRCPVCGEPWTAAPNGSMAFDSEIKDFFRRMRQVREVESKFGCSLTLEVREEKNPT